MSWRHVRALTLVLLGLLLASPLSSGDKGLWLSLASTPIQSFAVPDGHLPAEHSTVLPDQASRPVAVARTERIDPARSLGAAIVAWAVGLGERWPALDVAPSPLPGEPVAAHPAPRAPPA
jgi:hypothetical protein